MPCTNHGQEEHDRRRAKELLDKLTRMLCNTMRVIDDGVMLSGETRAWWQEHQRADRDAMERERRAEELEGQRRVARAKISDEDAELLGLYK